MISNKNELVTFFGQTNFRNQKKIFGIKQQDRLAHMYVIGKTGTGKSTLLETIIRQDIEDGNGLALLDPHGDLVEKIISDIPQNRREDVIDFNASDREHPLGLNPLERVPTAKRSLAASGLLDAFKKIWSDSWGPRTEHILRNAFYALLEQPQATLADILRLLDDSDYRKTAAHRVANTQVRRFWLKEYEGYSSRFRSEVIAPIQNKAGAFLANPLLNSILTQPKSTFDLRQVMDEGKILLVNLAKGRIGEDASTLLGSLLVSQIGLAALSRADILEKNRNNFFLFLDEFQIFSTLSFASMLSELRKYHVGLVLAHQYLSQIDPSIRDAILGNVGTLISFRLGLTDAELLMKEFHPHFTRDDLVNLPNYHIYLKMMIDGKVTTPFSGETICSKINGTINRIS